MRGFREMLAMRIEKAWVISLFLVLGACAASVIGCGDGGQSTTTSSGGSGGSGGSGAGPSGGMGGTGGTGAMGGTGGTGGTPMPECVMASDCKNSGDADFCGEPACEMGKCERKAKQPMGTPLASQAYGDCVEKQCDAKGAIVDAPVDTDVFNDGNECTDDVCGGGAAAHDPVMEGTPCTEGICDGLGACVQCVDGVQSCLGTKICINGFCAGPQCNNGTKDPGEGDIDCGGSCGSCDDGKACTFGLQCKSSICMANVCVAATCTDGVPNGNETGPDCGGVDCSGCPTDAPCLAPADCLSGVCKDTYCAAPTCTDAVKNGDEAGPDCGGSCPDTCP
jgi:hypothetical protein